MQSTKYWATISRNELNVEATTSNDDELTITLFFLITQPKIKYPLNFFEFCDWITKKYNVNFVHQSQNIKTVTESSELYNFAQFIKFLLGSYLN